MDTVLGCSTLREDHRLRVFVNVLLRKIFEPKREELTRGAIDCASSTNTNIISVSK